MLFLIKQYNLFDLSKKYLSIYAIAIEVFNVGLNPPLVILPIFFSFLV
jgi:hypothetical protein